MSQLSQPVQDMDADDMIGADDIAGARQAESEDPQRERMQEDPADEDRDGAEFDDLVQRLQRLNPDYQMLLAQQLPVNLHADAARAPLPSIPVMPQPMQPMQRPAERAIPPPEPKFDGSTNWPVYSIRVQQWLVACSTPPEQWSLRAMACITGPAQAYLHHILTTRNLSYFDLQIDASRFSWHDFDEAMHSGNFGSPPTDDSVRSKLLSFQQLKQKGQYNTAQHVSKVLLILQEAPHQLDDHTAIWLIRRTLYPALQQKVQLTAADQPFQSLQQFLDAVRHLGPVVDREEHEAAKTQQQQPKQQQQAGFKRPYLQGPGAAAPNPAAAAAGGSSAPQHPPSGQPFRPPPQQRRPGPSPHAGKGTYNPDLTPYEASKRRRTGRCYHCNAPLGRLLNHAPTCKWRLEREKERGTGKGQASDLPDYVDHYLEQKQKDPHNTSACFVVPKWRVLPHAALANMQVIKQYRKGYHLMQTGSKRGKGLLDDTLIYYDPPVPVLPDTPHSKLLMQYKCHVHGVKATVLLDSGAQGFCYVNRRFLESRSIAFSPSAQPGVAYADGAERPSYGQKTLTVHMQKYTAKVPCTIIDLDPQFDVIFGQSWLQAHDAVLYMATGVATLRHKGQMIVLSNLATPVATDHTSADDASDSSPLPSVATITTKAARRAVKQGGLALLVLVTEAQPPSAPAATDPQLAQMQAEFGDIFKSELPGLPPYRGVEIEAVKLQDENIRCRPMPRYSQKEKECIKQELSKLIEKGLIRPSSSPVGHPVLFVKKKDGGLRMVIDYRPTNAKTIRNQFPLPRIDELLDQLSGSTVWSALDMTSAYHQCRLLESDIPRTAFKVPDGLWEFRVLCFGLTNSPAVFSQMMMKLFRPYIGKFLLVYLDDLLVYSKTEAEHYEHLRLIFQLCRTHQLYLKLSKCEFFKTEVHYLGHVISAEGIRVDPNKTKAVDTWPVPKTLKQLRSFLGFANYFRKFIQGYSRLVTPLTDLTKGAANKYQNITHLWTADCQTSFDNVRHALTHAPVLAMPDLSKPFEVIADARGDQTSGALGAVLLQDGHPVAYESRKLSSAEIRYTTTEQELLGIIHALKVWRCFLEGVKFTVVTDHCPNTFFSTLPELNRRQARWSEFLQMFDFDWAYRPGRTNVADPLSRLPDPVAPAHAHSGQTLAALCSRVAADPPAATGAAPVACNSPALLELIRSGYDADPHFADTTRKYNLSFDKQQSLWLKGHKVVVPDLAHIKAQIFLGVHAHIYAGHFGVQKTDELITRYFWWPGLRDFVQSQIQKCDICQRNKPSNRPSAGKLMPLPVPGYRWEVVSLDFVTDLPKTNNGYDAVCVFVDKLTKMVHISPTVSDCDAPELAQIFLRDIYRLHGLPKKFLHDRGTQFMSRFFTRLCHGLGIQQLPSTAFHPQTDGQTERVNRVLEDLLRHFTNAEQTNWDTLLPMVEFAINNAKHASSGFTPFFLNYGLHPKTPLSIQVPSVEEAPVTDLGAPAVTKFVADLQTALGKAKALLLAAQDRQKAYADTRRSPDPDFKVGQEVLLSSKNIPLKHPGSHKLLPRWLGPFRVAKRISSVAYKLELSPTMSRLHPVFHVSLLKPYRCDGPYQPPPPVVLQDGSEEFEVETILSHRDRKLPRSKRTVREYLIKWQGYAHEHNTWEPAQNLTNSADLLSEYLARVKTGAGTRRRTAKRAAQASRKRKSSTN